MNYELKGETLKINNTQVSLPENGIPYQILEHNNIIVVLAKPQKGGSNRNILGFDSQGSMIWQIDHLPLKEKNCDCPFTSVSLEQNKLMAHNWVGYDVIIDPSNGKLTIPKGQRPW